MQHDPAYKRLFSHPEMVKDLLQGFVHEPWVLQLDYDSLEKVSGSYVTEDLRDREDDIIWRIRHKDTWLYIYLLLEFQSTVDSFMAVRVLVYTGLLYQDLINSNQIKSGQLLPPVFPLVLYNGSPRWHAAQNIRELVIPPPKGLERYLPNFQYMLIDEGSYRDERLKSLKNAVAGLFRLENSRTPDDIRHILENLIEWLKSLEQKSLEQDFTLWLKRVLLPNRLPGVEIPAINNLQEMNAMLAERVVEWTKEWKQQGLQEGLQQGRQQGRQEGRQEGRQQGRQQGRQEGRRIEAVALVLRLLTRRLGPLESVHENRIRKLSLPQMESLAEALLDFSTGDDLDDWLNKPPR